MTDHPDAVSWTIPADQVQTVSIAPPPVITINGTDGQPMVSIHPDGRIEYGPDYQPDEAARVFWDALQRWFPGAAQTTTSDGEAEVPRLFELWLDASDGSCRTAWGVVWPDGTASLRNANFPGMPAVTRQTLDSLLDTCGIDRKLQRVEWLTPGAARTTTSDGEGCDCAPPPGGICVHDVAAPAPEPGLRERYAKALITLALFGGRPHKQLTEAVRENAYARADAVLAVRDAEMQQLREELARCRDRFVTQAENGAALALDLGAAEAANAHLRERLPVLRRALESLPATCRYHGDQLDPDRFGRMTRSEACCDTGVPARRRREAENALTMLDQPQEQP